MQPSSKILSLIVLVLMGTELTQVGLNTRHFPLCIRATTWRAVNWSDKRPSACSLDSAPVNHTVSAFKQINGWDYMAMMWIHCATRAQIAPEAPNECHTA